MADIKREIDDVPGSPTAEEDELHEDFQTSDELKIRVKTELEISDFKHEIDDKPGSSTIEEGEPPDADFQGNEESKLELKTAVVYCEQLLLENNIIAKEPSAVIREEHVRIGEKIYTKIVEMLEENTIVKEDDLIMLEEPDEEGEFNEIENSASRSDDEYQPEEKRMRADPDFVPLDYKMKVVNMAKAHPKWSLKVLQKAGGSRLKRMDQLKIWEKQIQTSGTSKDKYNAIDKWTHDRFVEARQSNQQVTTRNLQQWALAAASQFPELQFKASDSWIKRFKQNHRIRQKKITKFVPKKETATIKEILDAAKQFRIQTRALITNCDKAFVINTDQTECQYQATYDRTLARQRSEAMLVDRKDMQNNVTHSYTVQYAMTLSGKLLPSVFVCLKEASDKFGPSLQKSIDGYAKKYKNIVIKCSRSGKLTTALYKDFLTDIMKPYVKKEKFILLIDSRGEQTNPVLYDEIFTDEDNMPTCAIKVIPPICSLLVKPFDVYVYRQVKNFIKRFENCSYVIEQDRELNSREDCIKIQSIIHHQLSAPIFCDMLQYAWFVAKLCDERKLFMNVNQVCFATNILKKPCQCKNSAFITCSRCRNNYCFPCFYDQYHPGSCSASSLG